MERFQIACALFCEDVRREDNGKEMLIGVYSGDIRAGTFPTVIHLVIWMQIISLQSGEAPIEIRLLNKNNDQVFHAGGQIDFRKAYAIGSVHFGPVRVPLSSEDELRLEIREHAGPWTEIKRVLVLRFDNAAA